MSSMNACPYPVEPRGLIITITYPLAANSSGFHRYDHESPQAPCGPPWMRNFTGYFFAASKSGGFTMKPSTFFPAAPANQNGSRGSIWTWERTASLTWVSCFEEVAAVADGASQALGVPCAK